MAFSERNFGKWQHKALGLDAKQIDRARKVHALAIAGATDGEKAAAMDRLTSIAANASGGLPNLLRALQ
jgi:hypothetical protein